MSQHTEAGAITGEASPPYGWAALTTLAIGLLYAITLSPTTAFWDTSEYIATGHILGIPHPPGNPLFVVLARSWDILLGVFGLSTAVRINLFSSFMSAMAHGLWFLVVHHILRFFSDDRRVRLIGAFASVLISATAFTVWNQSNVNEKVYTVSLFTIALLSWLAFRWQEKLGRGKDDNLLVLMIFILALSVGNHLMAFLAAPALGLFILMVRPRTLLNPRLYVAGVLAVVLGLSIHLFLPMRSGLDPVINEAEPTCESVTDALGSIVTYGRRGCEDLNAALNREQYLKPDLVPRQAPLASQVQNFLQYFDWQWARSLSATNVLFGNGRIPFTALFIALGVLGILEHYRRDMASWVYLISLFGVLSFGLVYYMNFKYGYSIPDPLNNRDLHEVRERDYFFIVGFSVWGLMAGIGITSLWQQLSGKFGGSLKAGSPILGLALIPLVLNFSWATRADDYSARDWAHNLLMSVEPYGILFTNGDNDTFPLWYLQEVEDIRKDVTVVVTSYLNTDWYVKQLRELTRPCEPGQSPDATPTRIVCQRPYDPENQLAVYTDRPETVTGADRFAIPMREPIMAPTRSIFEIDDETIERVAESYMPIESGQGFQIGPIVAQVVGQEFLFPWHQFALVAIRDAIGDRPIYFASSGSAAAVFGLSNHIARQGLAFRLMPQNLNEDQPDGIIRNTDTSPIAGVVGPWLDITRTAKLMDEVFVNRGGLPDEWRYWRDQSTVGIPNYYAWGYYALFQDAIRREDTEDQARYQDRAEAWTRLGR
ncbi:MAG: glycosyltransferase family 117 protein [Longimicrobiales bacterium]